MMMSVAERAAASVMRSQKSNLQQIAVKVEQSGCHVRVLSACPWRNIAQANGTSGSHGGFGLGAAGRGGGGRGRWGSEGVIDGWTRRGRNGGLVAGG